MINILLAGVGGQGTVLAAKLLAQAARKKGWSVRTAETIGMAQRGGNVTSHVRMGDKGEQVSSSLIARGTAQLVIAFEPAEAGHALEYLAPDGVLIVARSAVQPVTAALRGGSYDAQSVLESVDASKGPGQLVLAVDDSEILDRVGSAKVLNTALLACALSIGRVPLDVDDLRDAVRYCVKPRFVELNLAAIDAAVS